MERTLPLLACVVVAAACGTDIVVETGSSGASTGKTGSASASSTGSFATSSATTGAGGAAQLGCEGGFIDVDLGDGTKETLTASCPGGWGSQVSAGPVAYFFSGGAFAASLVIEGCGDSASGIPRIYVSGYDIDTASPSISIGAIQTWVDGSGATWQSADEGQVQTWKMAEKTGDTIEGTFAATVGLGGKLQSISGTFRVCKVDDEILP